MNKVIKFSTIAALIMGFSNATLAENRIPAELAATITPDYRASDMQTAPGMKYVWVKRIEGRDANGKVQVLFNEPQGALLPMDKLTEAHKLINPARVEKKGPYSELHLQIDEASVAMEKTGMSYQPLPMDMDTNLVLRGEVEVKKFEVSSNGLSLVVPASHKVAKIKS